MRWLGGVVAWLPKPVARARRYTWFFLMVLCYLIWFKYAPAIFTSRYGAGDPRAYVVPLGISYYSFKLMHYALERGRAALPEHSFLDFMSWLFLFPTFTAGPIERLDHYLAKRSQTFAISDVVEGLTRIVQGLIKKLVLVEKLNAAALGFTGPDLVAYVNGSAEPASALAVWSYLALTTLSTYLEFSAYSDMAIGAMLLFGIRIGENFDYPLLATNILDFWRRWHMSLTNWCRAYVYMPLIGITRNPYMSVVLTFVLVGLWHAANLHWLAWGLWHGLGQAGCVLWGRFAQKAKIRFFRTAAGRVVGWALTMGYVFLGGSLVAFSGVSGLGDSFRLMALAFGI